MAGASQDVCKRHRKTARVRRGDQLFGVRAAAITKAGLEIVGTFERAAAEMDAAGSFHEIAAPFRVGDSCWHITTLLVYWALFPTGWGRGAGTLMTDPASTLLVPGGVQDA